MSEVIIIDFDDSFTYNIAAQIYELGIDPRVVPLNKASEVLTDLLQHSSETSERHAIILGPGPGRPSEYDFLRGPISKLLERKNIFFMGVCLGHQIIWGIKGVSTLNCSKPVHGERVEILIPAWDVFAREFWGRKVQVQRYNSLTLNSDELKKLSIEKDENSEVPLNFEDLSTGECMGIYIKRCITYQFHPESVGTSFRKLFFTPITDFLYNVYDEGKNQNRRNL